MLVYQFQEDGRSLTTYEWRKRRQEDEMKAVIITCKRQIALRVNLLRALHALGHY